MIDGPIRASRSENTGAKPKDPSKKQAKERKLQCRWKASEKLMYNRLI
jgi:hypothetical protein